MDRRLLGAFLEHLGRAIYTGVYEPGSPLADANGLPQGRARRGEGPGRADHALPGRQLRLRLQLARRRRARRTSGRRVLERAWNSLETNQFGTNEFIEWCQLVGTEPLLGFNLGTGTPEQAVAYVEYCNVDKGTKWSDLRREHGYEAAAQRALLVPGQRDGRPLADGPHDRPRVRPQGPRLRPPDPRARSRPRSSSPAARATRSCPRTSSGTARCSRSATTRWTASRCTTTTATRPPLTGNDSARYLAMNLDMERQIQEIAAVCDYVQGLRKSPKRLWLSFDEWNVWYRARGGDFANGQRKFAPRAAGGGLQPRRRAAGGRLREHAAAPGRPRARGLPGPDRQRDRAARDQRDVRAAPDASTTRTRGR